MGHTCEVHHFLYWTFAEHSETCLAGRHHILMIAEDGEGMWCDGARRYVEHTGEQLTCNLVHIRNHQQQTLRCGVCCGQRTGLKRTMHGACGTGLTLHLLHKNCLTENILSACGAPVVDIFGHSRWRSDGIDCGHFAEHVAHVGCRLVAITGQKLFFFAHKYFKIFYCMKFIILFLSIFIYLSTFFAPTPASRLFSAGASLGGNFAKLLKIRVFHVVKSSFPLIWCLLNRLFITHPNKQLIISLFFYGHDGGFILWEYVCSLS